MPEFILDHGTPEAAKRYGALDAFTQGYIEAMFFTETTDSGDECAGATVADLSEDAWTAIEKDCKAFQELAAASLQLAYDYAPGEYDETRAGHDFWYTRNGHGTGYWDRGFGDLGADTVGGRLSKDTETCGVTDLYKGDDGRLYLS